MSIGERRTPFIRRGVLTIDSKKMTDKAIPHLTTLFSSFFPANSRHKRKSVGKSKTPQKFTNRSTPKAKEGSQYAIAKSPEFHIPRKKFNKQNNSLSLDFLSLKNAIPPRTKQNPTAPAQVINLNEVQSISIVSEPLPYLVPI
jgi:hypothetical protein